MIAEDKEELLKLARDSISTYFKKENPAGNETKFAKKQGVFVTLKKSGELRGCIGFTEPFFTLYDSIVQAARSAAFEDPRFDALTENELDTIEIEISVLTVPELIEVKNFSEYLDFIEIGKHGLIIRAASGQSGLLLPQVPVEWKWDVKEFLEHTCTKANLSKDAWTNINNKIYSFECEVFSENESSNSI